MTTLRQQTNKRSSETVEMASKSVKYGADSTSSMIESFCWLILEQVQLATPILSFLPKR